MLDAGVLRPDLPALTDVRLASARGDVDSERSPHRTVATGRYADAELLGLRVPGAPRAGTGAESRAPSGPGPAETDAPARTGSGPSPTPNQPAADPAPEIGNPEPGRQTANSGPRAATSEHRAATSEHRAATSGRRADTGQRVDNSGRRVDNFEHRAATSGRRADTGQRVDNSGRRVDNFEHRAATSGRRADTGQRVDNSGRRVDNFEHRAATSGRRADTGQRVDSSEQRAATSGQRADSSEHRAATSGQRVDTFEQRAATSGQRVDAFGQRADKNGHRVGDKGLVGVNAGGLATIRLGKSTADARWEEAYRCGGTGPLTRSATMLAGAQLLGGGGTIPAIRAMRPAGAGEPTSLLKLGPTGSARSGTDLVRKKGRLAVTAGAGVALSDVTLFAGTPQQVSIKVVTQPALTVTATGFPAHDEVDYRPAVLEVTAAGRPAATLDARDAGVGVELLGGLTSSSLLTAKISLGSVRQDKTGDAVRAEAAAVRVEVMTGGAHLLDVALGHLYAEASAPPLLTVPIRPRLRTFEKPAAPAEATAAATAPPVAPAVARPSPRTGASFLALTGANIAAAAGGGLLLILLGVAAVALTRRSRRR
ncbi:hypothetical protein [Paractinoplanes abujensis]|uniref:Gram-positive cocci surface proteins LPxTG domain-containing protein n=1 Tax=Paractinoplanes abujensis TaxID=882441 RepID=A0A7W7CKC2_9ACTN|nr:hypothetical protein [Actinoplanes abujensis]MBB4690090.1 hypothetical protein [Actinoplanes abujensis]